MFCLKTQHRALGEDRSRELVIKSPMPTQLSSLDLMFLTLQLDHHFEPYCLLSCCLFVVVLFGGRYFHHNETINSLSLPQELYKCDLLKARKNDNLAEAQTRDPSTLTLTKSVRPACGSNFPRSRPPVRYYDIGVPPNPGRFGQNEILGWVVSALVGGSFRPKFI